MRGLNRQRGMGMEMFNTDLQTGGSIIRFHNKNPDFEFCEILSILSLWLTWLYNELHFLYNPNGMCL